MDKGKTRKDLLKAGREKLQQFRKNSKGGSSKSSKAGKSRAGAEDTISLSESNTRIDPVVSNSVASTDALSVGTNRSEALPEVHVEFLSEDSGMDEMKLNPSADYGVQERDGLLLVLEDESRNKLDSSDPIDSAEQSNKFNLPLPIDISFQTEIQHGEEQVTDVGATQEAGTPSLNQIDERGGAEIEGLGGGPSNELNQTAEDHMTTSSSNTESDEAAHASAHLSKSRTALSIDVAIIDAEEAQESHDILNEPETGNAIKFESTDQQNESIPVLSNEEKVDALCISRDDGDGFVEVSPARSGITGEDRSLELDIGETKKPLGCKHVDLSSVLDGRLIKLSQLAEILDGEDMEFLLQSRELSGKKFQDTDEMKYIKSSCQDAFEWLKEQLYVTTISKDAFCLELSEHQNLIDEISITNASLDEVQKKNRTLAEEIVQSRYELQQAVSVREEMEKQLQVSNDEIKTFSTEINGLQHKLEATQGEMSTLLSELVDCRNLVEALLAEKDSLNRGFNLVTEEKEKLLEENEFVLLENVKMKEELAQCKASIEELQKQQLFLTESLTFARDDVKQLEKEKDHVVHEKSKFIADIAEYKSNLEALREENRNLNESLMSLSEERQKLGEEKESVVNQAEKNSNELMDCKHMISNLETEISNLNENLNLVTEERRKFEEEREKMFLDYGNQSQELAECKVSEADLRAECRKVVNALEEATFRASQLAEENETLRTNSEFSKSNIQIVDQENFLTRDVAKISGESEVQTQTQTELHSCSLDPQKSEVFEHSAGFLALKRHLEEAGTKMLKLEMATENMHLYSNSLSRSNDKTVSSGVSKLIQAFESKVVIDDPETEESPISENQTSGDPYAMTKLVIEDLEALLRDMVQDAENASEFFKEILESKLLAEAAGTELRSSYDGLREHADQVEGSNIELMVLYEAMKQNLNYTIAKEDELLILCDSVQKREHILKSENSQLTEKLNDFDVKVTVLQSQLNEIRESSEDTVASLSNKLKILQEEVANRQSSLEEEWDSIVTQILQIAGELDAAVETSGSLIGTGDNLDVVTCVSSSATRATKVIGELQRQLEAAQIDRKASCDAFDDMIEKNNNLQANNEMAVNTLNILHNNLNELVSETLKCSDEAENVLVDNKLEDLLHPDGFRPLLDQLKNFLDERMHLQSTNQQLNAELMNITGHIDELEKQCLEADKIIKLVDDIEQSLRKDGVEIDTCEPAHRIESVINLLFEKFKVAGQSLSLSTSLKMQVSELQGQVEHLNATHVQCENENLIFKQSLKSAEEEAVSLKSMLQEKVAELEQSEQHVASLREKLSIAVTKGKGLISQRDNLKQSLSEMSKELDKSSQELLSKDASLHELESKLEVYAEAGERMEALESELSYIRNSATALRESFLLKDSALQRIEEFLEDMEFPEHLYSRDIIEKIDWLVKSVTRNSVPLNDWDHRSSAGVGPNSDSGIVGVDEVREEMKTNPNSTEDLSMRYEELQNKFYELAEQNEMLEQSLMERNNHIQHWEEIMDKVDMPSPLRSLEPEDKIQWMESALAEAQNQCSSLQQKIDYLENTCGSQTVSLEDSRRRISEIETAFQQAFKEKETLSRDLEILRHDNDEISRKAADVTISNENLRNELNISQEQRLRMEEDIHHAEAAVKRLEELVMNALEYSITEDAVSDHDGVTHLEVMLTILVEKYKALSTMKLIDIDPVDVSVSERDDPSHNSRDVEEQELETLRRKLEDYMGELKLLKEEKDSYMLKNQSLSSKVEALDVKKNELEQLLNQEEQKSASVREKLNLAVRKGKSLVQQRDGMKEVIEELKAEVEHLKSETKHTEKAISAYEQRIKELSTFKDSALVLESETMLLRDRLAENECTMQEKEVIWSSMLDALGYIDVGVALNSGDPVEKVKELGKYLHDLRVNLNSAEQETRKSKRAAELLLAELNEVQERNDGLQEELAKASHLLLEVSREKDLAENAKSEALAHVEKLYIRSEEKDRQLSELMVLKSGVDQIREELLYTMTELGDVLSKDVEVLHCLEGMMKSFLEPHGNPELTPFPHGFTGAVNSRNLENKVFLVEIGSFRERLYNHSRFVHEEASRVAEVVINVHREYVSQKEMHESVERDVKQLELIGKERESELQHLRGSISLLYDTCTSTISEIENWKSRVVGNALVSKFPNRHSRSQLSIEEGNSVTNDVHIFNEVQIRGMREQLILLVKDFTSMQSELIEDGQREMKSTLLNLQKELQEKDVQRDRICTELVNQIKQAETTANNYMHEVQQVRRALYDLQSQVAVMEEERDVLDKKLRELKDQEMNATNLQQKVNSLSDALAAKEQENEALMQALDEEETQMEDLRNKIGILENELQQKKQEMENVEASRFKALKKHSIAVSKFDEVHNFSKNLVSEVEMLLSQLQERDGEISFLRQEVTRCTNDVLAVTLMSKKKCSDEILNVLMWFDSLLSRVKDQAVTSDCQEHQVNECKEILQRQIMSLVSELENLRTVAQNSDVLLQQERTKVEEFEQKEQLLKDSLRAKESQILALQGSGDFVKPTNSTSEIVEVEQMKNNWAPPGTSTQQVRSLRKANNDQVAIVIDMDKNSDVLEDDDDKAHGFKSLTTSKIVPRFTRPISDMVDGLWVSCDRALMRQPALRLGVIIYWAILHTLLATFVV